MHYHLEIIMPPTEDVETAVSQIMRQFDENLPYEDENRSSCPFWDWYVIGGRWSGHKMQTILGQERINEFSKLLSDRKVTVSGVRAGKPTLDPADQAELVNRLWVEHFPNAPVQVCPLFDNYEGTWGDVLPLSDLPEAMTACHVIIAGPNHKGDAMDAQYMVRDEIWNGVTHQTAAWDGRISSALAEYTERLERYAPAWREAHTPKPDWLVVTVDYHS